MAEYHLAIKPISRAAGRSATAAAAYRAGCKIVDERTGEIHDYSKKQGVYDSLVTLPGGGKMARSDLWNSVELHHKRHDAVVAREIEVALPSELTDDDRIDLAGHYACELADRYGVAVDISIHEPRTVTDRDLERDPHQYTEIDPVTGRRHNGNWHAHILLSACSCSHDGVLGKKVTELDPIHCQRAKILNLAEAERPRWAELANAALAKAGKSARVDHRTLIAQGIDRAPTLHLGPAAHGYERRSGKSSRRRMAIDDRDDADRRLAATQAKGAAERLYAAHIIKLDGDIKAAMTERDQLISQGQKQQNPMQDLIKMMTEQTKKVVEKPTQTQSKNPFSMASLIQTETKRMQEAKESPELEKPKKKRREDPGMGM